MKARLRLMGLLLGAAVGMGLVAIPAAGEVQSGDAETGTTGALPGHAVVYARRHVVRGGTYAWQIIWQPGDAPSRARVVHQAAAGAWMPPLYSMFGFLPSPDGRWLLVWETAVDQNTARPTSTVWSAVELPSGRHVRIAEQPRLQGAFPYWLDEHRLALEKGEASAVFDVRTRKLTGDLPKPGRGGSALREIDHPDEAAAWRRQYLAGHFTEALGVVSAALPGLGKELALEAYLHPSGCLAPDTIDDMLLRPLGILVVSGAYRGKWRWPELAVSPTGDALARAAVLAVGTVSDDDPDAAPQSSRHVYRARLDIYRIPSGERVGGATSLLWRIGGKEETIPWFPSTQWEPFFTDLRWSSDGKCLSYTHVNAPGPDGPRRVMRVWEAATRHVVLDVPDAWNGFVIPAPGEAVEQ